MAIRFREAPGNDETTELMIENVLRSQRHPGATELRTIRIMHVVRTLATGGTETVVRRLVSALDQNCFQQSVCTFVAAAAPQPPHTICLERSADKAAFLVPQLTRLFRRERPDIVHSRNWSTIEAVLAAKLAGIPAIVHSEHGRDLQTMGPQPSAKASLAANFLRLCRPRLLRFRRVAEILQRATWDGTRLF